MSDGPYRSLPMPTAWKRVARCGDNCAFEADQVGAVLIPALADDWKGDVEPELIVFLVSAFSKQEEALFKDDLAPELDAFGYLASSGLARAVLDEAKYAVAMGKCGLAALGSVVENVLTNRAARGARQIEEHYLRNSTPSRANKLRARIENAISKAPISGLVKHILGQENQAISRRSIKQRGLDDGVKL
jgi:hypothetical protein